MSGRTHKNLTAKKLTVGDKLRQMPDEHLAWQLMHCFFSPTGRKWVSNILVWREFDSRDEAYAATVAKLKEVTDE